MKQGRVRSNKKHGGELSASDLASVRGAAGLSQGTGLNSDELQRFAKLKTVTKGSDGKYVPAVPNAAAEREKIIQTGRARMKASQDAFGKFFLNIAKATPIGAVINAAVTKDPKKLIGAAGLLPGVGPAAGALSNTFAKPAADGKRGKEYLKAVAFNGATQAISSIPGVGNAAGMAARAASAASTAVKEAAKYGLDVAKNKANPSKKK